MPENDVSSNTAGHVNRRLGVVGGKGKSLAALASAGMNVPGGFCLATSAYRQYDTDGDLQASILDLLRPRINVSGSQR
jgi:phosphoenolpyruvate synthase/pyruvate phosphate dikinase